MSAPLSIDQINEHTHAAVAAYHAQDNGTARALCEAILQTQAHHPYALNLLGVIHMDAGDLPAALALFERGVHHHPEWSQILNSLAVCQQRMGDACAALASYRKLLTLSPDDVQAKNNLHGLLSTQVQQGIHHWIKLALDCYYTGQLKEAIAIYQEAISYGAVNEVVYSNLGAHLQDLGDWAESEKCYRLALTIQPLFASALYNLGHLISLQHRNQEAEELLRCALAVNPEYGDAYLCLGSVLAQAGRLPEAMRCIQESKRIMPTSALPEAGLLFNQAYSPDTTAADMLATALRCAAFLAPDRPNFEAAQVKKSRHHTASSGSTPHKIGFVSGDFKDHPVGYFTENLLTHANRERFEWHIFSNYESTDHVSSRLHVLASSWSTIAGQSDEAAKALIESKGIDVLFDLSGHTALHRLSLFAKRAAPVQITWLGWHDTTGITNMDYLLTDRASMPPQTLDKPAISEQALYLPSTRLCMMPPVFDASVDLSITPLPAQRNGFITFGSMQVLAKLSDVSLKLWACILQSLPTAKLMIRTKQFRETELIESFRERAASLGLPMAQVELLPPLGRGDYLTTYADIDILLDSYPYPGGTTTAEALWMGVPTITMGGKTMISRQGVSLLTAAGMLDWIAATKDDYVSKAVFWAAQIPELAKLRAGLRDQVARTALFDGAQFARDFEAAIESLAI